MLLLLPLLIKLKVPQGRLNHLQEGPGKGDTLLLASTELQTPLPNHCVISLGHCQDLIMYGCLQCMPQSAVLLSRATAQMLMYVEACLGKLAQQQLVRSEQQDDRLLHGLRQPKCKCGEEN